MGEHPWKAGRVLAGRYQLEGQLGEGGMGSIWRAQHLVLQAPVAVKLVDPEIAGDPDTLSRFMREAQAAAALRSPHVVQIIDYGVDEALPFMVMELLEGETLANRIKQAGRLSAHETVRIVTQVARAVQKAHDAGIVHRDLKPENVFLVHNQDEDVAKVLDFGVAKVNVSHLGPSGARTKTGSLLGTPYYMSPEQAQGNKAVDHRSDLWSLAVIVFEMLTGQRPFYSDGLGDLVLQICVREIPIPPQFAPLSESVDAWFARAMARDPDRRFQSAREMAESLREALGIEGGRETLSTHSDGLEQSRGMRLGATETPSVQPHYADTMVAADATMTGLGPGRADSRTSRAPTVQLGASNKPSLTVRQFGTASHTPIPAKGTNASTIVFVVAASALVIGLGAGFMLLRQREEANDPNRPLPAVEPSAEIAAKSQHADKPAPVVPEPPVLEPSASAAPVEAPPRHLDAAAEQKPRAEERNEPKEKPREPVSPPPAGADGGGWVKPDWARPDDEPPARPSEPDPAPPPPSDNPN